MYKISVNDAVKDLQEQLDEVNEKIMGIDAIKAGGKELRDFREWSGKKRYLEQRLGRHLADALRALPF